MEKLLSFYAQIFSGFLLFVITSSILYFFRVKQLYLSLTNLYGKSTISDHSSICQITVFNRGNSVEENIKIELNPNYNVSLLAYESSNLHIDNNVISLDLLHAKSQTSCMLLVENEKSLTLSDIQGFYSKNIQGKSFDSITKIPGNHGNTTIGISFIILIIYCFFNFITIMDFMTQKYANYKYEYLINQGWSGLFWYSGSNLEKNNYSLSEFPIRYIKHSVDENNDTVTFTFELINKTALPLKVTIQSKVSNEDRERYDQAIQNDYLISKKKYEESLELEDNTRAIYMKSFKSNEKLASKFFLDYKEAQANSLQLYNKYQEDYKKYQSKKIDIIKDTTVSPMSTSEITFVNKYLDVEKLSFSFEFAGKYIHGMQYTKELKK